MKTWIEISESALKHNIRAFREHLDKNVFIMAVVKANAYGHGLVEAAKIFNTSGAACFGVDNIEEGIALRKSGIKKPILILGYTRLNQLRECVKYNLSFVVYNLETIRALKALKLGRGQQAQVHLKIETGTGRQGVAGVELEKLVKEIKRTPGVVIQGVYTHFANIEDTTDHGYADKQLRKFQAALALLKKYNIDPQWKHTACSAAAILFPETHFNLVRLGISGYGLWPSKETLAVARQHKRLLELQPALTWKTVVAQVKEIKRGEPISYGLTERVSRNSKIAVLPVGYCDGYDRGLSGSAYVLIHGRRAKIMGRVCMNMMMADVTDIPRVKVEDEVVLLGRQQKEIITAEELANRLGTINYEIIARLNPGMVRKVI
jgi:alanine racemase